MVLKGQLPEPDPGLSGGAGGGERGKTGGGMDTRHLPAPSPGTAGCEEGLAARRGCKLLPASCCRCLGLHLSDFS